MEITWSDVHKFISEEIEGADELKCARMSAYFNSLYRYSGTQTQLVGLESRKDIPNKGTALTPYRDSATEMKRRFDIAFSALFRLLETPEEETEALPEDVEKDAESDE